MMNPALSHTLPLVGTMSDGHVLVLTDDDADCEEITRTDIRVPSDDKDDSDWFQPTAIQRTSTDMDDGDGWVDGMTLFALIMTVIGFIGVCANDMAVKAARTPDTGCFTVSR